MTTPKTHTPPEAERHLAALRDLSLTRLGEALADMLDHQDDALFELANAAGTNSAGQIYFDAMRATRLARQEMEHGFTQTLRAGWNEFMTGKPLGPSEYPPADSLGHIDLELIEQSEMEESIAVGNMAAKAMRSCYQELYDLTARLEHLSGRDDIDPNNHPISPVAVAEAFEGTVEEIDAEFQIKLIILKLFDKFVMVKLRDLYQEANAKLVRNGVLPTIPHNVRKYPRPPVQTRTEPSANGDNEAQPGQGTSGGGGGPGVGPAVGGWPAPGAGMNRGPGYGAGLGGGSGPGAGADIAPGGGPSGQPGSTGQSTINAKLLSALSELQMRAADSSSPFDPADLQVQLMALPQQIGGLPDANRTHYDRTAKLVSLVFDYIREDDDIPAPVQERISRLQVPVLKLALTHAGFFTDENEPARQLLNEITHASIGMGGDVAPHQDSLSRKIESIVTRILTDYDSDAHIFQELLDEFRAFLHDEETRAEIFEERTRRTTAGRERLEFAKQRVDAWVEHWVSSNLPEFVADFVRNTWRNTLLITLLKYGEDSDQWNAQVRTLNTLLWSINPKRNPAEARRLLTVLPSLLKFIRSGMELASTHPYTASRLFSHLAPMHIDAATAGFHADAGEASSERPDADDGIEVEEIDDIVLAEYESSTEGGTGTPDEADAQRLNTVVEAEEIEPKPLPPSAQPAVPVHDHHDQAVQDLRPGSWLEFIPPVGPPLRGRLSWRSEQTSTYLFVNWEGLRAAEKTAAQLAHDLRVGRARILDNGPLLDRAIELARHGIDDAAADQTEAEPEKESDSGTDGG